ncbi:MAG: hypothetical protein KKE62_08835 [Proteobacteria bacterium]|nr:hypothetical protein [Pseudomonadota bacterium]MBU1386245.1 hypothetical protein [Pseudomonadota bacterium]MBU1542938.1 hypothetical protein [Pseudomonadota bacterium]MBU2430595.1 hypothetical protein [Pseudomonadota bacterium]MBU2481611.1 hypothetical protein [Pseudomonadota bacterium]
MTMIIVTVIILAGLIGAGVMIKNKKKDTGPDADSPVPPFQKDAPGQEYHDILSSLLNLNILLRKDPDIPDAMTIKIETIIDDLTVIIPQMMERYPAETLTYEVKKIGKAHLYKTVKEYLDLSKDSRKAQQTIFENTIDSLHEVSHRSRDIIEKNETAEFKTMANFLSGKFS